MGFPCDSAGKESACNVGDLGSNHGLGRSPGEGKGLPIQYSGPKNSMDSTGHGVAKSRTRLSNFHSLYWIHWSKDIIQKIKFEKEFKQIDGCLSRIFKSKIEILWRRQWQPTPVFLPGESQGWGSLGGCHLWGRIESDTTEVT